MRIKRLIFVETGTYNDQALRPYETHVNDQTLRMIQEATHDGRQLQPTNLAGVAGAIVRPSAASIGTVSIENGWDTKRFRFLMEVEFADFTGGATIQYISGSTSHADLSHGKFIDPRMQLYLNNIVKTRQVVEMTPMGQMTRQTVSEASQILTGSYNPQITGLANSPQTMRPEDVFGTIGLSVLGDADTFDLRSSFGGGAKKSSRKNGAATSYLSRVMTSYKTATQKAEYSDQLPQMMDDASGQVREGLVSQDPFMSHLMRHTGFAQGTSVSYDELCQMQPGLEHDDSTVKVILNRVVLASGWQPHVRGQTEHWSGTTRETIFATTLAHAVPAIMMELMLTEITMSITNRTQDGSFVSQFLAPPDSFTVGVDLSPSLDLLLRRMETEVLRDLTMNNQIDIQLVLHIDVLGESIIDIAIMGGPLIKYVVPSFCDALMAPVITNNAKHLQIFANDISALADRISMDYSTDSGQPSSNFQPGMYNGHSSAV
jgi:hypothetical protein